MSNHNPLNERIKRQYFTYLKEAKRQSEAAVDGAAAALSRFEEFTKWRDFKAFHHEQAIAPDHRGRGAATRDLDLPADVLRFAPLERRTGGL